MAIKPQIPISPHISTDLLTCKRCGRTFPSEDFPPTFSPFFGGFSDICHQCLDDFLGSREYQWEAVDEICRYLNIPFIVKEWERLFQLNEPADTFRVYSKLFHHNCYKSFDWAHYNAIYHELQKTGFIDKEMPGLDDQRRRELKKSWGPNYDDMELEYLEDLYKGLSATQNISSALQIDQARKACKLSLEIDNEIRAGDSKALEKLLASYDRIIKAGEFTPKNQIDANDFDSISELMFWLEKQGEINHYYDDVNRDVIDETLKNIENYNQKLYINESGIGDDISQRLRALRGGTDMDDESDSYYGLTTEFDEDSYDNAAFAVFEDEEFQP